MILDRIGHVELSELSLPDINVLGLTTLATLPLLEQGDLADFANNQGLDHRSLEFLSEMPVNSEDMNILGLAIAGHSLQEIANSGVCGDSPVTRQTVSNRIRRSLTTLYRNAPEHLRERYSLADILKILKPRTSSRKYEIQFKNLAQHSDAIQDNERLTGQLMHTLTPTDWRRLKTITQRVHNKKLPRRKRAYAVVSNLQDISPQEDAALVREKLRTVTLKMLWEHRSEFILPSDILRLVAVDGSLKKAFTQALLDTFPFGRLVKPTQNRDQIYNFAPKSYLPRILEWAQEFKDRHQN